MLGLTWADYTLKRVGLGLCCMGMRAPVRELTSGQGLSHAWNMEVVAMGTRGPVPKRSEDRHRRNSPAPVSAPSVSQGAPQPRGSSSWSPAAKRIWKSLGKSGQARFFEPSDWAYAQFVMEEMTRYQDGERQNGQVLTAILSSLTSLMLTEGDRRRVGIELARPSNDGDGEPAKVEVMDKWRQRLG